MNIKSAYLHSVMNQDRFPIVIHNICSLIAKSKVTFDAIAFRGASGSLVAPIVALKLEKQLIMIRKDDNNHSYHSIEGYVDSQRFIIIDDLICTGNTICEILRKIRMCSDVYSLQTAKCAGIFLYNQNQFEQPNEKLFEYVMVNGVKKEELINMYYSRVDDFPPKKKVVIYTKVPRTKPKTINC